MNIQQKISVAGLAIVALSLLSGCEWSPFKTTHSKQTGLIVVNVLEKSYFDDCHIKGSINVPFNDIVTYAKEHFAPEADIVVYCGNYACSASSAAAKMLTEAGFKSVRAFEGGTAEALHAGIPTEGPATEAYLKNFEKPEGLQHPEGISVITVEALKAALEVEAQRPSAACCGK